MEEGIGGLRHLYMTVFLSGFASLMVIPAITDITMLALCPGQDECSLAIYLSGFQQAIIGLGTVGDDSANWEPIGRVWEEVSAHGPIDSFHYSTSDIGV
ncbi:hippocampus abundant transcript-like protein 1 isoform X2 [Prunus yedoensis var. nudiflora]|uniref:Hippocampus abundant transcript-like protein 1 isoform X2 n=1 Tax=Prunus yedoensis var. nudiflora TaxID=2094558 RepID=A0A314YCB5_PRUYE|nr:hippocampus abundant transcript-like protein 1 isoform X2 [Prunus yedoensis var. nudiflora]